MRKGERKKKNGKEREGAKIHVYSSVSHYVCRVGCILRVKIGIYLLNLWLISSAGLSNFSRLNFTTKFIKWEICLQDTL